MASKRIIVTTGLLAGAQTFSTGCTTTNPPFCDSGQVDSATGVCNISDCTNSIVAGTELPGIGATGAYYRTTVEAKLQTEETTATIRLLQGGADVAGQVVRDGTQAAAAGLGLTMLPCFVGDAAVNASFRARPRSRPVYRCKDGKYLAMGIVDEKHLWKAMCQELGLGRISGLPMPARTALGPVLRPLIAYRLRNACGAWSTTPAGCAHRCPTP